MRVTDDDKEWKPAETVGGDGDRNGDGDGDVQLCTSARWMVTVPRNKPA